MDARDMLIATETAKGKTQLMIEAETGIPQYSISRRLKKAEVRELVENLQSELIQDTAEDVKTTITGLVKGYKANTCKGRKAEIEKEHGFKCISRIAEMTGMFPSHTPSILVQQNFNQSDSAVSEELHQLKAFLEQRWKEDETGGEVPEL
ncbi:MAG TPA: hypothetical protein DCR97_01395 [Deltaproteobacteria bacterium]|nr:hypothetical protein [Deltaproteobacteria bacterium]